MQHPGSRKSNHSVALGGTLTVGECVFCDIESGQAESSTVYEDDTVMAFMDLRPVTPGHLLVVPRTHAAGLEDLDENLGARVWTAGHRLARAVRRSDLRCEGVNLFSGRRRGRLPGGLPCAPARRPPVRRRRIQDRSRLAGAGARGARGQRRRRTGRADGAHVATRLSHPDRVRRGPSLSWRTSVVEDLCRGVPLPWSTSAHWARLRGSDHGRGPAVRADHHLDRPVHARGAPDARALADGAGLRETGTGRDGSRRKFFREVRHAR